MPIREESRIHVNFEVAASSDLALPVALLLYHPPAELVLHLEVTHGVLVCAPTVL